MLALIGLLALFISTGATTLDDPLAAARAATDREDWAQAAAQFLAYLNEHPEAPQAPEARFWNGFCRVKLGENEEAVATLAPFNDRLADDKWADDALLQLGRAAHGLGKDDDAIAAWRRHLDKYPQSVWRTEVSLALIDVLFHHATDLPACLDQCRRLTEEVPARGSTTEARYLGAYCLNALRKFDESEAWADRLFDPESALEEAWRHLLGAQRDLLRGRVDAALTAVDGLVADFPDIDQGGRQDLLLKAAYVLRFNGRADRARELLRTELVASAGRPEDEVDTLLEELDAAYGEDRRADYLGSLARLSADPKAPMVVRVAARDHHAQALADGNQRDKAEVLLRAAIAAEDAEFPRFRAAIKLADLLADDPKSIMEARAILERLRPGLKRRDLVHQLQQALEHQRRPAGE